MSDTSPVAQPVVVVRPGQDAKEALDQALFEVRHKVYPRAVHGWFAAWRWALVWATQLAFYGTAWLTWNGRQAVLFDIAARKFYIFGMVFWPQDIFYLAILLILSALSLFLFTTVAGRLWCGYACPQTVYTEIFLWIERRIEGDRAARMKLDSTGLGARKLGLKAAKHAAWIAFGLWTGFTFVGYFTPIRDLAGQVISLSAGPWESFWMLFYGFATYGNAGWMREQVCKYMCPYARFQSAMFDRDTMIITYDQDRGEPRGGRSRSADARALGLGDCVDCGLCVQVCPTGIDIRKGLQYECIGCAACVDACGQVMAKMNYPQGLIRYATVRAMDEKLSRAQMFRRALRPRVLVYAALLVMIAGGAMIGLYLRVPLKVDVLRDRAAIAREVEDGQIENVYRLQIMNTTEHARTYRISVSGLHDIHLAGPELVEVAPEHGRALPLKVRVHAEQAHLGKGSHRVEFTVSAVDAPAETVTEKAIFVVR